MVLRITPEKREEKERIRHALLRAALRLGAQHGFASLGLREVSRAASIAPTSFYRHFTDMAELGVAIVQELGRPLLQQLAARSAESGSPASLVDAMFSAVNEDAELVRFLIAERAGAFPGLRQAIATALEVLAEALHAQLTKRGASAMRSAVAVDAAMALVLVAFARLLELAPDDHESLRERLVRTLGWLLEPARSDDEA